MMYGFHIFEIKLKLGGAACLLNSIHCRYVFFDGKWPFICLLRSHSLRWPNRIYVHMSLDLVFRVVLAVSGPGVF